MCGAGGVELSPYTPCPWGQRRCSAIKRCSCCSLGFLAWGGGGNSVFLGVSHNMPRGQGWLCAVGSASRCRQPPCPGGWVGCGVAPPSLDPVKFPSPVPQAGTCLALVGCGGGEERGGCAGLSDPFPGRTAAPVKTCSIRRARCIPQHRCSLAGLPQSPWPRLVMCWRKPDPERMPVLEILSWGTGGRCPVLPALGAAPALSQQLLEKWELPGIDLAAGRVSRAGLL